LERKKGLSGMVGGGQEGRDGKWDVHGDLVDATSSRSTCCPSWSRSGCGHQSSTTAPHTDPCSTESTSIASRPSYICHKNRCRPALKSRSPGPVGNAITHTRIGPVNFYTTVVIVIVIYSENLNNICSATLQCVHLLFVPQCAFDTGGD